MPIVTELVTKSPNSRAVVVNFQNGKIEPTEAKSLESNLLQDKDGKPFVAITSPNVLYTGCLDEDEDYRNFILVHDEDENTVQLMEIDECTVFPKLQKENVMLSRNMNTSVAELNKQFGSKKTKRITEQKERMVMNVDAVKEQVERTAANTNTDNPFDEVASEGDSLYRPRINRNASTREGVYNLDEIVPITVLETLVPEATHILHDSNYIDSLTPFCADNVRTIISSSNTEDMKCRNVTIFLYIHYLIKFMNTPVKNLTKRYIVCSISEEVNRHILDTFCVHTQSGRTRPLHMKDKSLSYIMALAAIANDFEVNVALLAKDLKIGLKKAVEISRILAFTTTGKDKSIAVLKLPLPAPVTFNAKRKVK